MSGAASRRWPAGMTPGLARLRANGGEAIRKKILDEDEATMKAVRAEREAADASASIIANSGEELAAILAANRRANAEAGARVFRKALAKEGPTVRRSSFPENLIKGSSVIAGQAAPAPKPAAAALSDGASKILHGLIQIAADAWIDQKAIPHGLTGRAVPGYLCGLARRGLIELRADGGRRFSARATAAGVALLAVQP